MNDNQQQHQLDTANSILHNFNSQTSNANAQRHHQGGGAGVVGGGVGGIGSGGSASMAGSQHHSHASTVSCNTSEQMMPYNEETIHKVCTYFRKNIYLFARHILSIFFCIFLSIDYFGW